MAKSDSFFSELYLFFRNIFYGSDQATSIFSFNGKLNRCLGWATACVLNFMLSIVGWFNIDIITYMFAFVIFYCVLALIQKRCRDYGSSGTYWIIFASFLMLFEVIIYFFNETDLGTRYYKLQQLEKVLYCFLVVPLLIPSKANVDERIRSPLLKHPLIYTLICVMLAIGATIGVNYYNGVNIL